MKIGVIGLSHKSSELALREQLAKAAYLSFEDFVSIEMSFVLLSTCNRTEIYFSGEHLDELQTRILYFLRGKIPVPFEHKLYSYFGIDCFTHLSGVISGLDSALLFETDILRQVKGAYAHASAHGEVSSELHFLFQKSLKIGKWMRHLFPHSLFSMSLERSIFFLVKELFREIFPKIMFIGNSEVNRKILHYFYQKGFQEMTLCTRNVATEREHLDAWAVKVCDWNEKAHWNQYELVICASHSQSYCIGSEDIQSFDGVRTQLVLDLAVPRNVDPCIGQHMNVNLLNIDELSHLMKRNRQHQLKYVFDLKEKIREEASKQIFLFQQKRQKETTFCLL